VKNFYRFITWSCPEMFILSLLQLFKDDSCHWLNLYWSGLHYIITALCFYLSSCFSSNRSACLFAFECIQIRIIWTSKPVVSVGLQWDISDPCRTHSERRTSTTEEPFLFFFSLLKWNKGWVSCPIDHSTMIQTHCTANQSAVSVFLS